MRKLLFVVASLATGTLVGCSSSGGTTGGDSSTSKASAKSSSAPTSSVAARASSAPSSSAVAIGAPGDSTVINFNPDGPNHIDESKLKGDAASCAKVKACCEGQTGAIALGCQMAIGQELGDCAKIAATVVPLAR